MLHDRHDLLSGFGRALARPPGGLALCIGQRLGLAGAAAPPSGRRREGRAAASSAAICQDQGRSVHAD